MKIKQYHIPDDLRQEASVYEDLEFSEFMQIATLVGKENVALLCDLITELGHHNDLTEEEVLLIESCLINSISVIVRYGCVLALSYLNRKSSLSNLRLALEKELIQSMRKDIYQVIISIESEE